MNQRINLAVLAALTAGLVAACGSGGDADTKSDAHSAAARNVAEHDTAPLDVCALVDSADLDRLFADTFSEGELVHLEQTGGDQCIWDNGEKLPLKQFSVSVWREEARSENFAGGDVTAAKLWAAQKDFVEDAQPVELGDDAYLSGSALEVLDGKTIYSFTTGGGQSAMAIDGMKQIAAQVVNR
jgi:hypothetical protein